VTPFASHVKEKSLPKPLNVPLKYNATFLKHPAYYSFV